MSIEEVAAACGLSPRAASLAKQRHYDEPFRIVDPDPAARSRLLLTLQDAGVRVLSGGRFDHAIGDADKGRAAAFLRRLYRKAFGPTTTVGLGDALNDAPLLRSVDVPIIVRGPSSVQLEQEVPWARVRCPRAPRHRPGDSPYGVRHPLRGGHVGRSPGDRPGQPRHGARLARQTCSNRAASQRPGATSPLVRRQRTFGSLRDGGQQLRSGFVESGPDARPVWNERRAKRVAVELRGRSGGRPKTSGGLTPPGACRISGRSGRRRRSYRRWHPRPRVGRRRGDSPAGRRRGRLLRANVRRRWVPTSHAIRFSPRVGSSPDRSGACVRSDPRSPPGRHALAPDDARLQTGRRSRDPNRTAAASSTPGRAGP